MQFEEHSFSDNEPLLQPHIVRPVKENASVFAYLYVNQRKPSSFFAWRAFMKHDANSSDDMFCCVRVWSCSHPPPLQTHWGINFWKQTICRCAADTAMRCKHGCMDMHRRRDTCCSGKPVRQGRSQGWLLETKTQDCVSSQWVLTWKSG